MIKYMESTFDKIFTGENKYTVGMVFIFANLMGFFHNMRKLKVGDFHTILILSAMIVTSRLLI